MNKTSITMQSATVAEQGARVAPEQTTFTRQVNSTKGASRGKKGARKGSDKPVAKTRVAARVNAPATKKVEKTATKKVTGTATVPREFSKKAIVLDLLRRNDGATMGEITEATGWQSHSIRGFISGTVGKKLELAVESAKNDAGERTYRLCGAPHNAEHF